MDPKQGSGKRRVVNERTEPASTPIDGTKYGSTNSEAEPIMLDSALAILHREVSKMRQQDKSFDKTETITSDAEFE